MSFLSFMLGPAVGALIGGLTNRLAISMLFRPYEAKHIGPFKIPLTPGIIPKEKGNIAHAIGNTTHLNTLDAHVLQQILISGRVASANCRPPQEHVINRLPWSAAFPVVPVKRSSGTMVV